MPVLLLVFLLPLALLVAAGLARIWEKRLVWPYAPADESMERTSYMTDAAARAQALRFKPIAALCAAKGGVYRIRYELWLSGDGETLLLIGGGRLAAIPVNGSWLFTRLSNGRCVVTLDEEKGSEPDLTGLVDEDVRQGASLEALLTEHGRRVAAARVPPLPYSERDALAEHRDFMKGRIEVLVTTGYARYADPMQSAWTYTPRGALLSTWRGYWGGLRRAFRW